MQLFAVDISGSVYTETFSKGYFDFVNKKYQEILSRGEPVKILLWAQECHAWEVPEETPVFDSHALYEMTRFFNNATHPSTIFENKVFKESLEAQNPGGTGPNGTGPNGTGPNGTGSLTVTFLTDGQINENQRVNALSSFVRDFSDRKIDHTDIVIVSHPLSGSCSFTEISNIFKLISNSATETIYTCHNDEVVKKRSITLSRKAIQVINASNQIELSNRDVLGGNTAAQKLIDELVAELSEEEVKDLDIALKDLKRSKTVYLDDQGNSLGPHNAIPQWHQQGVLAQSGPPGMFQGGFPGMFPGGTRGFTPSSFLGGAPSGSQGGTPGGTPGAFISVIPLPTSSIFGVHGDSLTRSIVSRQSGAQATTAPPQESADDDFTNFLASVIKSWNAQDENPG